MSTLLGQLGTRGVRLGRIAGIPVTLDWTWFPIAFLLVFGISSSLADALGTPGAIVTAVLLATGFFGSETRTPLEKPKPKNSTKEEIQKIIANR